MEPVRIGMPTRNIKEKNMKCDENMAQRPLKILLTNKTPRKTSMMLYRAQRTGNSKIVPCSQVYKPRQCKNGLYTRKEQTSNHTKVESKTIQNVKNGTNKFNQMNATRKHKKEEITKNPKVSRREQLESWRAKKGITKKEDCHPLLSRKRALSNVLSSPTYKPPELKKVKKEMNDNKRRTFVVRINQTLEDEKVGHKRRHTMQCLGNKRVRCSSPVAQKDNSCSPALQKTPWRNKILTMRERLDLWLTAKGKTPYATPYMNKSKRIYRNSPHPNRDTNVFAIEDNAIPENLNCTFTIEDSPVIETSSPKFPNLSISESDFKHTQTELNTLLEKQAQNVDSDEIQSSLDLLVRQHSLVVRQSDYWICRARLAAESHDVQRVICLLEQAYTFDAKPEEKIKEEICRFIEKIESEDKTGGENDYFSTFAITPGRRVHFAVDMSPLEFKSSIIKFCIIESKAFKKRLNAQLKRKIMTPLRRSIRLQKSNLPSYLRSNYRVVESPSEVEYEIIDGEISFVPNKSINTPLNKGWLIKDQGMETDHNENDNEHNEQQTDFELSFM